MTKNSKSPLLFAALLFLTFIFFLLSSANAQTYTDHPVVKLQSLDKVTARTMTFEARVGSTVKFGSLYIKIQSCRKSPPIEKPEAASFLQIWEIDADEKPQWIFSGWMFASSPALSPMDHPVYDVWVLDCMESKTGTETSDEKDADNSEASNDAEGSSEAEEAPALPATE